MGHPIPRPSAEAAHEDHNRRHRHALNRMRHWAAETERLEQRIEQELENAHRNAHINEDPRAVTYNFERSPLTQALNGDLIGAHRRLTSYAAIIQAETHTHQTLTATQYLFPEKTHLRNRARRTNP